MSFGFDPYSRNLPERSKNGRFYIQILTSDRILRWPYGRNEPPPMYNTEEAAQKVLKEYVKFANNSARTIIKRSIEEFLVVEIPPKIRIKLYESNSQISHENPIRIR